MFNIVFSNRANETFDSIQSQLHERWGTETVLKFEQRTIKVLEIISITPFIYQAIAVNSEVRKAFIHKNCSLFYKISGQKIVILFFWDNRQEPIFL